RIDVPGGRYTNPGYVDMSAFEEMTRPIPHRSRVRGLPMIAGFHTIAELPDEILVPGDGQVRALIMSSGNPVVTGPAGSTLDRALGTLELFVAHDLLQRESHRHAHWLIPAPHFLEREDLLAGQSVNESARFAQLARRVVEPPATTREEHEFFVDLAVAMDLPLFGDRAFIELVRQRRANASGRLAAPGGFDAHQFYRQALATAGKVTLEQLLEQPHGFIYGAIDFGHTKAAFLTPAAMNA